MANFNTHFTVGAGASAVVSATLLSMEVVTPEEAVIAFGYLVHLTLDELYSVDLENRRMKRSSGTALKLGMFKNRKQQIHTFIIYALIPLLFLIAPNTEMIQTALFSYEAWLSFVDIILPYDGRWFFH